MTASLPTRGQLERSLSQQLQALYRERLGHRPREVMCQIFDEKVAIILENAITPPEQILATTGKEDLAEQVNAGLGDVIDPEIKKLIAEVLGVGVVDLLKDSTLATERTGIIAILAEVPQVRDRHNIPKTRQDDPTPSSVKQE